MKLMVLLSRVPFPLEKGDKLRAYHQIKELHKHHEILLCCVSDQPVHPQAKEELSKVCSRLEIIPLSRLKIKWNVLMGLFSNKPFQVKYFYQRSAQRQIDRIIDDYQPDHIYCQLIRASEYVRHRYEISKTLDYMDAFSKGYQRRAETESALKRPFYKMEAERLWHYEHLIFELFDAKTIISEQDREHIRHEHRHDIEVIPNGVDVEFFHPQTTEKKYDLVFNGNMSYPPNIDAAVFLANEILPEVWKTRPETSLLISGASPTAAVKALANDRITVSGWVEDVRDSYAMASIFIAPMQIGTGLQNKLLEAMSMEIPCITSTLANNALNAKDQESILIGNSVDSYRKCIEQLLDSETLRNQIAAAGREFVQAKYDWKSTTKSLENLFKAPK